MDFSEAIKLLAARIVELKDTVTTEEATKTSFILPFFQTMGYDIFNPHEFVPEFTADVGIKKGEKVDYAVIKDGKPIILIECKECHDDLSTHSGQLFRYFGTTTAKIGILTNGIVYKFFTDLDAENKMDSKPFLTVNLITIKKNQLSELSKFQKQSFDLESITSSASDLKYSSLIQNRFAALVEDPSEDFVKLLIQPFYEGKKSQKVIEYFQPLTKRSIAQYINDMLNAKISNALETENKAITQESEQQEEFSAEEKLPEDRIVTTAEEMESFYIVRSILAETVEPKRIVQKDTETYFGILLDGNTRKWICRISFTKKGVNVYLHKGSSSERRTIEATIDLYSLKQDLIDVVHELDQTV